MTTASKHNELLPHLFRQEYAKMTAVLCRHFGLKHIEIAEDIASETFLKASEYWITNGIPANPTAWLYVVAKNKAKDYLKHQTIVDAHLAQNANNAFETNYNLPEFDVQIIADSQLSMIFAVCDPANSKDGQIALALQILCGFSIEEIANAFLTKTETIKKRLLRARTNLRNNNFQLSTFSKTQITDRLPTVLQTLYLLFNEGYFSKTDNQIIRKDLCAEAMRLCLTLTENPNTNVPKANALLALMCFQSSRLNARSNSNGEAILFEEQDRTLWDKTLIDKGNYYLINACQDNEVSKYHLEAAIAYWHSNPNEQNKWPHILNIYNQLIILEYSPTTALNRIFAFSKVYGNKLAIFEAEKLKLTDFNYYHSLLGFLYTDTTPKKAIEHYKQAISLTKSNAEIQTLTKEIVRIEKLLNLK